MLSLGLAFICSALQLNCTNLPTEDETHKNMWLNSRITECYVAGGNHFEFDSAAFSCYLMDDDETTELLYTKAYKRHELETEVDLKYRLQRKHRIYE